MDQNGQYSNGHAAAARWRFARPNDDALAAAGTKSIRAVRYMISGSVEEHGPRPVLPLAHGDPSVFPSFRTATAAEDAVATALHSAKFNCYPPGVGLSSARRAVADYLSRDLPYKLSSEDVFLTAGGTQAIEVIISVLARPGTNILLPRPGYPNYAARAAFNSLEVRHFDLIPERGWEIDLESVQVLADKNTVAMVVASITNFLNISTDPATFIQGALPHILENSKGDFFERIIALLMETSEICFNKIKEIRCITCPHKPEGAMFVMVKLNLCLLDGIHDDIDFCCKLAKEESVILCPGVVLGMQNWLRITFAIEPSYLLDGLERIKSFCIRHKSKNMLNGS